MKPTGRIETVCGRRLFELEDGFWRDENGLLYDYRLGKLFCEKRPGVWYRVEPMPVVPEGIDRGPYSDDERGF